MKRQKYLLFLLMLFMAMSAMAQKQLFTGIVKDVQGDPIIGASIVEKNASNGSVTDLDGKFSVSTIYIIFKEEKEWMKYRVVKSTSILLKGQKA